MSDHGLGQGLDQANTPNPKLKRPLSKLFASHDDSAFRFPVAAVWSLHESLCAKLLHRIALVVVLRAAGALAGRGYECTCGGRADSAGEQRLSPAAEALPQASQVGDYMNTATRRMIPVDAPGAVVEIMVTAVKP